VCVCVCCVPHLVFSLVTCCLVGFLNGPRYDGTPAPAFELLASPIKVVALLVVILLLCSLNEHLPSAPVDKYSTKAKRERCSSRLNQHYCRLSPDARPWWNRHKQLALNNSISRWKPPGAEAEGLLRCGFIWLVMVSDSGPDDAQPISTAFEFGCG
jgi:hypothetical protein